MNSHRDNNSIRSNKVLSYDLEKLSKHGADIDNIDELTSNPLKCGFLLAFCESEYSAENMHFVVEIDRFRDYYLTIDRDAWNSNLDWRSIDNMIGLNNVDTTSEKEMKRIHDDAILFVGGENSWPSRRISFNNSVEHIQKIWDTYLSPQAPKQICIPYRVLQKTRKRLENFHLYGGFVFEETLFDPFKTLKRDSIPRYIVSNYYRNMQKRLDLVFPLPEAHDLALALPSHVLTAQWTVDDITVPRLMAIPLSDMLQDRILYAQFHIYCKKLFLEENLYCARAISIFKFHCKGSIGNHCPPAAEDMAWTIFRYFVSPKAVYEISLSHRRRKELMQSLASPMPNMFRKVENSVFLILRDQWVNFTKTSAFQGVPDMILDEKKNIDASLHRDSSHIHGCFPFF